MTTQEKAQEVYNDFYKRYEKTDSCFGLCNDINICDGTGHGCGLWKVHAKESAIYSIQLIISELEQLRKPEYTTFILDYKTQETSSGEEKLDYWHEVIGHINNI